MNYKKLIDDYREGLISETMTLVFDNDGGYWSCDDDDLSDDQIEEMQDQYEKRYGSPDGYSDLVDLAQAAGINAEWC